MPDVTSIACLEVWGGNEPADTHVRVPGLDVFVYALPFEYATAGGDVHFVSSCGSGRIARLMVADVSGHGSAVAETGRQLRSLIHRYMNHIDQRRLLMSMNEQFVSLAETPGTFESTPADVDSLAADFDSIDAGFEPTPASAGYRDPVLRFVAQGDRRATTNRRVPDRGSRSRPQRTRLAKAVRRRTLGDPAAGGERMIDMGRAVGVAVIVAVMVFMWIGVGLLMLVAPARFAKIVDENFALLPEVGRVGQLILRGVGAGLVGFAILFVIRISALLPVASQ